MGSQAQHSSTGQRQPSLAVTGACSAVVVPVAGFSRLAKSGEKGNGHHDGHVAIKRLPMADRLGSWRRMLGETAKQRLCCGARHAVAQPSPAPAFQGKHPCFHPTADGHVKTHDGLCAEAEHQPSHRAGNGVRRQKNRQRAQTVRPSNRNRKARRPMQSGNNTEQRLRSLYTPPPGLGRVAPGPGAFAKPSRRAFEGTARMQRHAGG